MKRNFLLIVFLLFLSLFTFSAKINVRAQEVKGEESRYILKSNVLIQKGTLSITTEMATITLVNDDWRNVDTTSAYIMDETFQATSSILQFDLQTEKGTLKGNVVASILLEDSIIDIICDELLIDNNKKMYEGKSEDLVFIKKDDYVIHSKSFVYLEEENLLTLSQEVHIVNNVKKIDMNSTKALFNTKTNDIEAQNVNLILEVSEEE